MRKRTAKGERGLFSIIIPSFNVKEYLIGCLGAIFRNVYPCYEVIVVDNGSTDGSLEAVRGEFSDQKEKLKTISLPENFGPAKARNEGAKIARGEYLGFLDSDTQVDKNWIIEAEKCFRANDKVAAIQCKLLLLPDKTHLDCVGEYLGELGFLIPVAEHGEKDSGQYDHPFKILAAKSAGMFIRSEIFRQVGGFDEDYFIFMEETDLGWRCWLTGYQVVFCPSSVVYHHFSATKQLVDQSFYNYLVRFHGTKNYLLTLYKNLSFAYLWRILPIHLLLWLGLAGHFFLRAKYHSTANILRAVVWNLVHLSGNWRKRRNIQKQRVFSDEQLFSGFGLMKKRGLAYLINKFSASQRTVLTTENR